MAVVDDKAKKVILAAELNHRGHIIKQNLDKRRAIRRSRRNRKTRYRQARFNNRRCREGWPPPSLESRLGNIEVWVKRFRQYAPIVTLSVENVKFDTQKLQDPEITGVQYQQGELFGYEVREYLLEKFGRECVYCGATNVPFEIEHIVPKSRVGTNQVSNLAIACKKCNLKKGNKTAEESGYPDVQKQAKQPLRDAAAVNAMRLALLRRLEVLSLPLETGSGAETKYNRIQQGHPKAHWIDAACVGASGSEVILNPDYTVLVITATGRGSRQMCSMDKYGFPRSKPKAVKRVHGFQTGDMVKVVIEKGKYQGVYIGRAVVKGSGYFDVATSSGKKISTSWKRFRLLQRFDGYAYDCRRTTTSVRLK